MEKSAEEASMDRNIYIDLGRTDGPTGILFGDPDSKAVYTGLEICAT